MKALLKDMADEGLLDIGPARAFHKMGGVPKVTVLRIVDVDDTTLIATPERWEAEGQPAPPPSPATAVEETIRLAARHGFSRARLTLRPAELGSVEVVLKASAGGVAASVLADTPEAARLLEASGGELRSRLEAQGLQLLGLSVSVSHDAPSGAGPDSRATGGPQGPGGASGELSEPTPDPARTIELGGGVLVDVLA